MPMTMKDVALRAGVSFSTVSHVLNNTRYVSEELRTKVLKAMEDLGYTPNQLARSLRSGKTGIIGMVVPDTSNPFFGRVAYRVQSACFSKGYTVVFSNSDGNFEKEKIYTKALIERHVDGIIFIAGGKSLEHLDAIQNHNIPILIADREVNSPNLDSVISDHKGGGHIAAQHLIDLGHSRIGCITGASSVTPSADRVVGYREALKKAGLKLDESLILRGNYEFESGYQNGRKLLLMKKPPTAIFACNDLMAIGVIRAANELGFKVPHNLSVVGFDNVHFSKYCSPPLTTVHQAKEQMANVAVDMLIERINNPQLKTRKKVLNTRLIIRQSTTIHQ